MLAHTAIKPIERLNNFGGCLQINEELFAFLRFRISVVSIWFFSRINVTFNTLPQNEFMFLFCFTISFDSLIYSLYSSILFAFIGLFVFLWSISFTLCVQIESFNFIQLMAVDCFQTENLSFRTQGGCAPTCYQRLNQN